MAVEAKKIIIFGASGFIGKHLFDKFSKTSKIETIGFSSKELNLLSIEELKQKLSDLTSSDVLIVTAAITRLRENTYNSMLKNIQMVDNIANLITEHPVGQVVYLSTIDVYGIKLKDGAKINERNELCPHDYYAVSKLVGEFLLKRSCARKNISLLVLRLCGIYGPGDTDKSTIYSITSAALRGKKIYIYGDGKNLRDYIHVDDLYMVIKRAIGKRLNATVNVATGKSYSISEIAHIVQASLPAKVDIKFKPSLVKKSNERVSDLIFNCTYFKTKFPGLKPMDLKAGIPVYLRHMIKDKRD